MEKSKIMRKTYIFLGIFAVLSIAFCAIYATQMITSNNNLVLKNYERVKYDSKSIIEEEVSALNLNQIEQNIKINNKSEKLLKYFDKDITGEKEVKMIYNKLLDRTVTRVITESSEIDFDINGNLVSYKNLDDYTKVNKYKEGYIASEELEIVQYEIDEQSEIDAIISKIEKESELDEYKLVDCSNKIEGAWVLTWCKEYSNGFVNPYECVNVVVDAKDGSIWLYGRNTMLPNTLEPVISEDKAIKIASKTLAKYTNESENVGAVLAFTRPNFYFEEGGPYQMANFVRLCYNISTDSGLSIYVDAVTGEILGGDQTMAVNARSMVALDFVEEFERPQEHAKEKALSAEDAFRRLGYAQDYGTVYWPITQTDIDWILNRSDMYALYLHCHGNVQKKGLSTVNYLNNSSNPNLITWTVYSNKNYGDWHFVFLDACLTSSTKNFANAFNCTGSRRAFVGWNVSVTVGTSYTFNMTFFPKVGTMSIYDNVIETLWQLRDMGYDDPNGHMCDPGFIGDLNYWGEAW